MGHSVKEISLRGKFIGLQAYLKKQEKSQTNTLNLQLKELEKKTTNKDQSRRKKIIMIRAKIIKMKSKKSAKDQ